MSPVPFESHFIDQGRFYDVLLLVAREVKLRRVTTIDRIVLTTLVPLWAVFFLLSIRTQIRGDMRPAIGVSSHMSRDGHLAVTGGVYPTALETFQKSGLQRGDHLIRMGGVELRGFGPLRFYAMSTEQARGGAQVRVVAERDGRAFETALPMAPFAIYRGVLGSSFFFLAGSILLLLRAPRSSLIRTWFHAATAFAFMGIAFGGSRWAFYVWTATLVGSTSLAFPLLLRFLQRFPHGTEPEAWPGQAWPWLFSMQGAFNLAGALGAIGIGARGAFVTLSLASLMGVAVLTRNYRRGDPVQRRQIKWVLFGAYCAAIPVILAGVLSGLNVRLYWLGPVSWWVAALMPISLLIAVARYNLFDIDRLLGATISYNVSLAVFASLAFTIVPRVAAGTSRTLGIDPDAGQILISAALVAILIPAHARLRLRVDRTLFKERHAINKGITELLQSMSACNDVRHLTTCVGQGLQRLFKPDRCVVYAAREDSYAPVWAEGRAVLPDFKAGSPLVTTLRTHQAALSLSDAGRQPDDPGVEPFDRAALETLEAEVIVPVRQDDALVSFLCLGPRQSGDVYTSTDLSLLMAVAEKVRTELRRFDQEETIREAREMQDSLRRYVPGAVADEIATGGELAAETREVSVLFVDLRGYTQFSERRAAAEIFSTVNRYTQAVSAIVREAGGSVVEFHGDGLMAVFGAPRELLKKERAAVEAALMIIERIGGMWADDGAGGRQSLGVGVGIATGEAYVGNIRAVDRLIWSAVGNTTNLAARLQGLTRELDAKVVIDETTWRRAGVVAHSFDRRSNVSVRGRQGIRDVYLLPLDAMSAALTLLGTGLEDPFAPR